MIELSKLFLGETTLFLTARNALSVETFIGRLLIRLRLTGNGGPLCLEEGRDTDGTDTDAGPGAEL